MFSLFLEQQIDDSVSKSGDFDTEGKNSHQIEDQAACPQTVAIHVNTIWCTGSCPKGFSRNYGWATGGAIVKRECKRSSPVDECELQVRLQLHDAIYRPDSFVMMLRYCANLKAIRYESTSLNRS